MYSGCPASGCPASGGTEVPRSDEVGWISDVVSMVVSVLVFSVSMMLF